jgi:protocatechuate 3,4-dioxygenase beta subunit
MMTLIGSAVLAGKVQLAGKQIASGVEVGGALAAFHPTHVAGPDAGTSTCPVCKYGARPAVQAWFNAYDPKTAGGIAKTLDKAIADQGSANLKAFLVFIRPGSETDEQFASQLRSFAEQNKLQNVAVTYVPAPTDGAVKQYQINTDGKVRNTVFVYRNRKVASKFVNLTADAKDLQRLSGAIRNVATD